MAQKRKVANLMALAVLATVVERPMHRYEMASVMRARGKERDMGIKWGSLYTVVQNLERNGYLETIGVTRQGARPERTVYQITDAGRDELVGWTREPASRVARCPRRKGFRRVSSSTAVCCTAFSGTRRSEPACESTTPRS